MDAQLSRDEKSPSSRCDYSVAIVKPTTLRWTRPLVVRSRGRRDIAKDQAARAMVRSDDERALSMRDIGPEAVISSVSIPCIEPAPMTRRRTLGIANFMGGLDEFAIRRSAETDVSTRPAQLGCEQGVGSPRNVMLQMLTPRAPHCRTGDVEFLATITLARHVFHQRLEGRSPPRGRSHTYHLRGKAANVRRTYAPFDFSSCRLKVAGRRLSWSASRPPRPACGLPHAACGSGSPLKHGNFVGIIRGG